MGTAGLAALAGRVDGNRSIPIAGVENLAVAGSRNLLPGIAFIARGVDCVFVAGAGKRTEIEQFVSARLLIEGVTEIDGVKLAPGPMGRIGAQKLLEFLAGREPCAGEKAIAHE